MCRPVYRMDMPRRRNTPTPVSVNIKKYIGIDSGLESNGDIHAKMLDMNLPWSIRFLVFDLLMEVLKCGSGFKE